MIRADVDRPEILRGERSQGEWEPFSGTLSAAGFAGLEGEVPLSGWITADNIAFRVKHPGWDDVIVSGTLEGGRLTGEVVAPDGRKGTWQGWWIVPRAAPAAAGEPRLIAVEE